MRDLAIAIALILVVYGGIMWLTLAGDKPDVLIDATPAASTACVKVAPLCDANCVRLTLTKGLA